MLVLVEKRFTKIFKNFIILLIPLGVEVLMYLHSTAFRDGVFGFGANQRILTTGLPIENMFNLSVFIVVWCLICATAYFKEVKEENDLYKWAVYIPLVVTSVLFSLIFWHPQWLLLATPFLAITTFTHKKADFFLILDIIMMYFFIAFTVNVFPGNVDQSLWGLGIFKGINQALTDPNSALFMNKLFRPNNLGLYYSLIASCFLINVIFKYPGRPDSYWNGDSSALSILQHLKLIQVRFFLGVSIFIIPAIVCLLWPTYGSSIYNTAITKSAGAATPVGEIVRGVQVGEVFKGQDVKGKKIAVQMANWGRTITSHLEFKLGEYDVANSHVLYEREFNAGEIKDNSYLPIELPNIQLSKDKFYYFYIESQDASPGNAMTIWHTAENINGDTFAIVNGNKQKFDLHFTLYGEK